MILVGFFAAMLALCSEGQTGATAVESTPGLEFIPKPDPANPSNTLIYYKSTDEASVHQWTSKIDQFLQQYSMKTSDFENRMACDMEFSAVGDKYCDVPIHDFHPCTSNNQYNYRMTAPCVFLKLDKIVNWTPNPYNTTEDLPQDMPVDVMQHIRMTSGRKEANMVWVSCEGQNPADKEFIGPIQYIPRRGFPAFYFPVTTRNQEGYLSPLVAVLFERPRTGVLINIECKAWAKNIFYDRYERRGSVHFELMVD